MAKLNTKTIRIPLSRLVPELSQGGCVVLEQEPDECLVPYSYLTIPEQMVDIVVDLNFAEALELKMTKLRQNI